MNSVRSGDIVLHLRRRLADHDVARMTDGMRSAVLILLYERAERAHLVLTRRTDRVAHHRGQVCLPGGRFDHEDGDLLETALRETREELGIPTDDVHIVGRLDDVHTRGSGFVISPFVGAMPALPEPTPNPDEIARVLEIPVAELLALDAALPPDPSVETLRYPMLGEDIWGATARILHNLCAHLRAPAGAASVAVAHRQRDAAR